MMYGFENDLREAIIEVMGNDVTVEFKDFTKNNGIVQRGCMVREEGYNVSPTIYIDDLANKGIEVGEMAREIVQIYKDNRVTGFDTTQVTDWKTVKPNLRARLVNAERNEEYVADKVHAKFLNLYVVPFILLGSDEFGTASTVVTKNLAEQWGVDDDEILYNAIKNLKHNCQSMHEIMTKMMLPEVMRDMELNEEEARVVIDNMIPDDGTMWVATNYEKVNGATVLLDNDLLHTMADKLDSDLIVIPSSVHEVIIVPTGQLGVDDINSMIGEVNTTQVDEKDYLSDTAYFFNRETGDVTIA